MIQQSGRVPLGPRAAARLVAFTVFALALSILLLFFYFIYLPYFQERLYANFFFGGGVFFVRSEGDAVVVQLNPRHTRFYILLIDLVLAIMLIDHQ